MTTPILKVLEWLWKWQKKSKYKDWGEGGNRYLGTEEKGMVEDVSNFLKEIRMQNKLPDILRQRNISVDEFKRLEDLRQLYKRSRGGDEEAQRILNERYSSNPAVFDEEMRMYNRIKSEMHNEGEQFILAPFYKNRQLGRGVTILDIPDLPDEPTYPPDSPDIMPPVAPPPEVDPREELGREFLDRLGRNFKPE